MEQPGCLETRKLRRRRSTASSSQFPSAGSTPTGKLTDSDCTPDSEYDLRSLHSEQDTKENVLTTVVTSEHPNHSNNATTTVPRKRGRPRKHPIIEPRKTAHARSRTGCATCRRRKKKCDERKPTCLACEKNNVFCDGYEPLLPWKSGRDKVVSSPLGSPTSSIPDLPLLVDGVENETDQYFLQHFLNKVSTALFINDHRNVLQDIITPMAMSNKGLMHSVLYLSSSCLLAQESEQKHPEWDARQEYHMSMSMRLLHRDLAATSKSNKPVFGDVAIAHTLLLCLQTMGSGDVSGSWRIHTKGLEQILMSKEWICRDGQLHHLAEEFLIHHECCASITSLSTPMRQITVELLSSFQSKSVSQDAELGALIGVQDGLFHFLPRIRALRDKIRTRKKNHGSHWRNNQPFEVAFAIDNDLRAWECCYPIDSLRYTACLLYRQSIWLFLHRSVQPSIPSTTFHRAVEEGLQYLATLNEFGESSVQSVVLMPLFLLGCAAFDPQQRTHIAEAFKGLQEWSDMGHIRRTRAVIEQIWHMMDTGRAEETWDWETLITERAWDFVVT